MGPFLHNVEVPGNCAILTVVLLREQVSVGKISTLMPRVRFVVENLLVWLQEVIGNQDGEHGLKFKDAISSSQKDDLVQIVVCFAVWRLLLSVPSLMLQSRSDAAASRKAH